MRSGENLTKETLLEAFDQYCESLRRFLYYKTGDVSLVEDLIQEVFMKVWEKRSEIRASTVGSLLFKIANNLVIDHYRRKSVALSYRKSVTLQSTVDSNSPEFIIEEKEFEVKLKYVLDAMPANCREVFLMSKVDQIKYEEIADRLELSVKAIEKRMSKAIRIVKEQLGLKL